MLKIIAANPDAVYIFAAGTPGALPQIELAQRGYKGLVYQTQGVANNDFLRVGGKIARRRLHDGGAGARRRAAAGVEPDKKPAVDFVKRFEKAHGAGLALAVRGDGVGCAADRPAAPRARR